MRVTTIYLLKVAQKRVTLVSMKMHEPVGKPEYGALFLRLPFGAYFVLAGLMKLKNVNVFIQTVKTYNVLPENASILAGVLIPYLEVGGGVLLLLGLWTTLASSITGILLATYIYSVGFLVGEGKELFNKDLILLGVAISLLFTGPGRGSIDGFRK